MGEKYVTQTITGYNGTAPPDDDTISAANKVEWQKHLDEFGAPLKTLAENVNSKVKTHLDLDPNEALVSGLVAADYGTVIETRNTTVSTSSLTTITMPAFAGVRIDAGWWCIITNAGKLNRTVVSGDASETIDGVVGLSTFLVPGESILIMLNAAQDDWMVLKRSTGGANISSAYVSTDFPIDTTGAVLRLDFDTNIYDPNGYFDRVLPSSNTAQNQYIYPAIGYYRCDAKIVFKDLVIGDVIGVIGYESGTLKSRITKTAEGTTETLTLSRTFLVETLSGIYTDFEIRVFNDNRNTSSVQGGNDYDTYLMVEYLGQRK